MSQYVEVNKLMREIKLGTYISEEDLWKIQRICNRIQTETEKDEWIDIKTWQPDISDKDLLLLVKDDDDDEPYHCEVGYFRGLSENGEYLFDNCYHGWVQGNVVAWKQTKYW